MNPRVLLTILITALLVSTVIPITGIAEINPPVDRGDGVYENSGDWTIEAGDNVVHTDRTIVVNGNLTILGSLTLTRCELVMNNSDSTLLVDGELYLEETNITGTESAEYFFIVNGKLDHKDSNLFNIAGAAVNPFVGGLQIYSEDVHIDGGSIQNAEFTGIYIAETITLWNLSITNNLYNVVMNGSSPDFINCTIRYPGSVNLFMVNGSTPTIIGGDQAGEIKFDDENSSLSYGHALHVHVTFENGTSIPDVSVTAMSQSVAYSETTQTDEDGWVRNMVLPEETRYKTIADKVYTPYRITVEKFGLVVMEIVPLTDETTIEVVLVGDYFGEGLSRGDYNGDGDMDLAVGVPRNRTGTDTHGAVFVFLNKGGLELSEITEQDADLTIQGEEGLEFGSILASGDINGDGFDDLLIGTPLSDENGENSGKVRFYFGSPVPSWNDMNNADLTFDGEPGNHYGKQLLVTDLNGDEFEDFIIGDDRNTFVYFSTANPGEDFTLVSEVNAVASSKGKHDTTGQSLSKIQTDDDDRYKVSHPNDPNNILHITNFTFGDVEGEVTSATMWFQFTTDQYYGYNSHERNYIYYNVGEGWQQSIRPRYNQGNWRDESTWSFDLFENGITSMDQLKQLQVYLANIDGTNNSQSNNNIYFDFISVQASFVPKGANHTLGAGNVSSGDVNGDGYQDIIISDASGQTVYFNGPLGISAPEVLQMDLRDGNTTNLRVLSGELSISETRPYLNGQFDDGWDGWQQTVNTAGQKDGGIRWSIIDQENEDWKVHEGATGGFGSDRDELGGWGGGGGDCRGMIRTKDFLITDDMETISFWFHFKARSFEGLQDQSTIDRIRYAFYSADNNSVLKELAGWYPPGGSDDHEEDGYVNENLTDLRGETVYLGVEIITNQGNGDRALAQIDNVTISPPSDIPYYTNASLVSEWMDFEGNISTYTPSWVQDTSGGEVSVKFRTENVTAWDDIPDFTTGDLHVEDESSSRLQYRIEMSGDGTGTPTMSDLSLAILLEGQIIPLPLSTEFGSLTMADMNGDGFDDILFLDEGTGRGQGIDIFYGIENMSRDYDPGDIVNFYTGDLIAFSVFDLESDGTDELCLVGDSIRIIDQNSDVLWERSVFADRIAGDAASDPSHELSTGDVYFIPSHDLDVRIIGIDVPNLVDPGELQAVGVAVGNVGTQDVSGLTLSINITADGYEFTDTRQVQLDSMVSKSFDFFWDVPEDEGVVYTISLEFPLDQDRLPANNDLDHPVTSKEHIISITSPAPAQSAHGGDDLLFPITIENIGTFATENVTLDMVLPANWVGGFRVGDENVSYVIVTDSVDLTFRAASPSDEINDDFTLNLSGTAETAIAYLDLTATILRPDLIVEEIRLVRADGVITNDTIHGVAGDGETIEILIRNQGPTYSTGARVWLFVNTDLYEEFTFDRLESGESMWFSSSFVPDEGDLDVYAEVDPNERDVHEENETNNDRFRTFSVKSIDPVGTYNISGRIQNIFGEPVAYAQVRYEWGADEEENITNEDGNFTLTLDAVDYYDGQVMYFNGTDGENVTSIRILLYSEDGRVYLLLTLNQYLVEITGPDSVSNIDPDDTITIDVEVTNKGNINSTFVFEAAEIPTDWSVTFLDFTDSKVFLSIEETVTVTVEITSSADPMYSKGHLKYFVTVFVFAEIFPAANDSFSHGIDVNPYQRLVISTDGANTSSAQPGDPLAFDFIVENLGNEGNTYIPELIGGAIESFEFNVTYVSIDINGIARFSLAMVMPYIGSGSVLELEIGSVDPHVTNAEVTVTALDLYDVECEFPEGLNGLPGSTLSIPLTVTNTGNLVETITASGSSIVSGVIVEESDFILTMQELYIHTLKVTLPDDALSGALVPIDVTLATEGPASLEFLVVITILEFRDLTLELMGTEVISDVDFTTYLYEIKASNTGNGVNTFHFKGEGTHPQFLSLPSPVTLTAGENATIFASIVVPFNRTGVIDNYIVPTDDAGDYDDLNLRILSYTPQLATMVHKRQSGPTFLYDIYITNNGVRFERLGLELNIPEVDGYQTGDARWEGWINKDFIELMPGTMQKFTVWVTTPEKREFYSSDDLSVTMRSDTGRTIPLVLHKPPIAILGTNIVGDVTFEDTITFTGSQSVWDILYYNWDFGDGTTLNGSSVQHSFGRSGLHRVTLTVEDEEGLIATDEIIVEIGNMGPIAVVQTNPGNRTVEVGKPIRLDASFSIDRDGDIVKYLWEFGEFGDFFEGIWPAIEHSYKVPGSYTIIMHVTDNSGMTTNTTLDVTVIPASTTTIPKPTVEEKTVIDPMTYIPAILLVLVLIAGLIFIMRKRMFVDHLVWKIAAAEDRK